jgi:hypothetical protein
LHLLYSGKTRFHYSPSNLIGFKEIQGVAIIHVKSNYQIMRKSASTPCLSRYIGKRNVRVQSVENIFSMNEIIQEIQVESALHIPATVAIQCDVIHIMPKEILKPERFEEEQKQIATCALTPVENDFGTLQHLRNIFNNQRILGMLDTETLDKYMSILKSIRKQRRRIA